METEQKHTGMLITKKSAYIAFLQYIREANISYVIEPVAYESMPHEADVLFWLDNKRELVQRIKKAKDIGKAYLAADNRLVVNMHNLTKNTAPGLVYIEDVAEYVLREFGIAKAYLKDGFTNSLYTITEAAPQGAGCEQW